MRIGFSILIGVTVALASTWIIVTFIDLPPELISESFYSLIRGLPYIEVQFLFILGGDPIHSSNPINHGLLLNFNVFPYFNTAIWLAAGIVAGIFTQGLLKGVLAGLNTAIVVAIIGWVVYWAILFGFDFNAIMSSEMIYLLGIYCANGLTAGLFAAVGGLLGGLIGKNAGWAGK